jgi:hypothetical protein
MTPDGMLPFFVAYTICASAVIFSSLFAVTVFLGLAILDVWNGSEYNRSVKLLLSICMVLFPEIGVMSWSVYFGKARKFFFRLIAFGTSAVYLLLQTSWFYLSMKDKGLAAGLISGFMAHVIWLPLVWVGGVASFFILRSLLGKNSVPTTASEVQKTTT